jgi:hypothetical protein
LDEVECLEDFTLSSDIASKILLAGVTDWSNPGWLRDVSDVLYQWAADGCLVKVRLISHWLISTLPESLLDKDLAAQLYLLADGDFCTAFRLKDDIPIYPLHFSYQHSIYGLSHFKGPMTDSKGPMTDSKGPMTDFKGPMTDFKGPMTDSKGPMTDFKGPMTDSKGPMTDFKSPMTMLKPVASISSCSFENSRTGDYKIHSKIQ